MYGAYFYSISIGDGSKENPIRPALADKVRKWETGALDATPPAPFTYFIRAFADTQEELEQLKTANTTDWEWVEDV